MTLDNEKILKELEEGDYILKFSDIFELKQLIGYGAYGFVVRVVMKSNKIEYALKCIHKSGIGIEEYESLKRESEILAQFNHPNIVKFIKLLETEKRVFLVMELAQGGQLKDVIEERKKEGRLFNEEEAASIARGILSALQCIHSKDIIHRDIKPENVLLADKNDLSSIKICDFGLAAQIDTTSQIKTLSDACGTKIYMAPETLIKKKYSKPVDIWSCGIIIYMLLSGNHPIYDINDTRETYLAKMEDLNIEIIPNITDSCSHLLSKLLHADPLERYTAEQCLQHPWITRNPIDKTPITVAERMKLFDMEQSLSRLVQAVFFLNSLRKHNNKDHYHYHINLPINIINADSTSPGNIVNSHYFHDITMSNSTMATTMTTNTIMLSNSQDSLNSSEMKNSPHSWSNDPDNNNHLIINTIDEEDEICCNDDACRRRQYMYKANMTKQGDSSKKTTYECKIKNRGAHFTSIDKTTNANLLNSQLTHSKYHTTHNTPMYQTSSPTTSWQRGHNFIDNSHHDISNQKNTPPLKSPTEIDDHTHRSNKSSNLTSKHTGMNNHHDMSDSRNNGNHQQHAQQDRLQKPQPKQLTSCINESTPYKSRTLSMSKKSSNIPHIDTTTTNLLHNHTIYNTSTNSNTTTNNATYRDGVCLLDQKPSKSKFSSNGVAVSSHLDSKKSHSNNELNLPQIGKIAYASTLSPNSASSDAAKPIDGVFPKHKPYLAYAGPKK